MLDVCISFKDKKTTAKLQKQGVFGKQGMWRAIATEARSPSGLTTATVMGEVAKVNKGCGK